MSGKEDPYGYRVIRFRRKTHTITWVFLGIFGFIAVFIPFLGMNLQYYVGTILHQVFNIIGELFIYAGWLLLGFNIISLIARKKFSLTLLAFCIILLWIGAFLTGQAFDLFGFTIGSTEPPQGYH